MSSMKDCLLTPLTDAPKSSSDKVTIVGAGNVGMASAIAILTQNISGNICLIDVNEKILQGEFMDLQHGERFLNNPKITASKDYAASAGTQVCVITAGARQKEGESRLALVERNANIIKDIVPKFVKYSPDSILLVVCNPVDIMSYFAWKVSGFPKNRVIGSGTNLDTSRFRFFMGQLLGIAPTSCHGWIIGEHGDSSVPVWSSVNVAGVRLRDLNGAIGITEDPEKWHEVHKEVVTAAYKVIQKKGYTSWSIGLSVACIVSALLRNTNEVLPVSTSVLGEHCIEQDVFLSLPCVLNANGVTSIVKQNLDSDELELLHKSAEQVYQAQCAVEI